LGNRKNSKRVCCKLEYIIFQLPSVSVIFNSHPFLLLHTPIFTRNHLMATAPLASSSPLTAVTGDTNTTPPPSSSAVPDASPSPFAAIDFLTVCHHLKVLQNSLFSFSLSWIINSRNESQLLNVATMIV